MNEYVFHGFEKIARIEKWLGKLANMNWFEGNPEDRNININSTIIFYIY